MNNSTEYQKEINIIFSCLEKLKNDFKNIDNLNQIANLEEYKNDAVELINNIGDTND